MPCLPFENAGIIFHYPLLSDYQRQLWGTQQQGNIVVLRVIAGLIWSIYVYVTEVSYRLRRRRVPKLNLTPLTPFVWFAQNTNK